MDSHSSKINIGWYLDILPRNTQRALDFLAKEVWLKESRWYLAGGTALALQAGHRISVDLDFFTEEKDFENSDLFARFMHLKYHWEIQMDRKNTIYGKLMGAKVSFIAYPFFIPDQAPLWYGNIRVLDKRDIAVMKIIAISQRGRKRDFFDLYWCARNIEPLEGIIKRLKKQYPSVAHNYHHILKALVHFDDAESDPDPVLRFDATWRQVKMFMRKEVPAIALRIMK